ncbi:thiol reductant ABC exporter subunit CydD [Paradesulfitobacterium ferrireducens]|uniref:thiol reductant ABC exporter subunit CydD n=1 Tax=Paradesulfitobacterium ferrireducens TaxID=2816476 RepID=UPI001A8F2843|nr:thiol reductant ABC exporter subunit CydD [Paradesulfitobacterium ferrireducens]
MLDKRMLGVARGVARYLAWALGFGWLVSLGTVFQAKYLALAIDGVFLAGKDLAQLWPWLKLALLFMIVRALGQWLSSVWAVRAAVQVKDSLRSRLLGRLVSLGPLYVRGEKEGELLNLLTAGVDALEEYFARYLPQLALAAIVPLTLLLFIFPVDYVSGIIVLVTVPLIPLFMILIGKMADHKAKQQWQTLSRMSGHFLDVLKGLATLKLFGRSRDQSRVIARISDEFRVETLAVLRVAFLSALVLEFLATISTALVAVSLGLRLVENRLSFVDAFFLLQIIPEVYLPLRQLGSSFHTAMSGVNAAEKIFALLADGSVSPKLQADGKGREEPPFVLDSIEVEFRQVTFAYAGESSGSQGGPGPLALDRVSFSLCSGQKTALVGPSGAGKSSVVNLLLKYAEPADGEILINGRPLAGLTRDEWYRHVAVVAQHPSLFSASVRANIALGDRASGEEEIRRAARLAGAEEFIARLPQGYETVVGEGGVRLSGGQAQRIALARAFLKNAPLLILDEPTAGLDVFAEEQIEEALAQLCRGRTVLVIAHRLSTVEGADRILVLDRGKIVEAGRHQELYARQALYYRLIREARGGI